MATGTTNYGLRKPDTNDNVIVLTDIADNMDDIDTELKRVDDMATAVAGGVWADYTPTWASSGTQPAIGANGTLKARWARAGKIVHVKLRLVAGAATTFGTGDWTFSLPVASATHANLETVGTCLTLDAGTGYKNDVVVIASGASTFKIIGVAIGGFYNVTTPMAWAVNDSMNVSFTYEAA